jgi:hypothetical protein
MKIIGSMFLIVILAAAAPAQEINTFHSTDTLVPKELVFPSPKNSLGSPSFLPTLRLSDNEVSRDFPTSSLAFALLSEPSLSEKRADLSWQMTLSRKKEDPLETLRAMLGAVEKGGAAYLAYRHISKYGFLK